MMDCRCDGHERIFSGRPPDSVAAVVGDGWREKIWPKIVTRVCRPSISFGIPELSDGILWV